MYIFILNKYPKSDIPLFYLILCIISKQITKKTEKKKKKYIDTIKIIYCSYI